MYFFRKKRACDLHSTLFLSIFAYNIKLCTMDSNSNQNTGNKGVFPGANPIIIPTGQGTSPENVPGLENSMPTIPQPKEQAVVYTNETNTYIRLETKNSEGQLSGVLEIDLISFRERGQESRYLSVNVVGAGQDGKQSETTLSIDNEEDFNRFKKFISDLNWND